MTSAPKQIAAAVQGHVRALRLLGWEDTCIEAIAQALGLQPSDVELALRDYKIVGATIDTKTRVSRIMTRTVFSPVINLRRISKRSV